MVRDRARRRVEGGGPASQYGCGQQCRDERPHASPPARSASGGLERDPGLRPSTFLYHVINAAVPIITRIPSTLITTCIHNAPVISIKAKWPEKARNTPRQKISSECWPHKMAG